MTSSTDDKGRCMTDMQKRDEMALEKSFNFEKYDSGNGEEYQELSYEEGFKAGFSAAHALQAEKIATLESCLKIAMDGIAKELKANSGDCACGAEESDGRPVTCYLHKALEQITAKMGSVK